ncbi:inositol phosphate phosphatase SopB [Achromobacter xylosoxidans]|uniref:inositol phosphate phosphatase SopB n=1 Tax=Alcaligenes xylosoxydans xylosoxydans TaxID=85698 RepID=UPI00234A0340|nr:inositol phosphate phosphatase SopB [Achromobacter xylosoxidans]MDC6165082.1 inositol phosphate phosphatase SopB [Achromobacter xylosoxidans]
MNMGIEQFRGIGTGRYDLDRTVILNRDGGLQRGESVLAQRVKGWANKLASYLGGQQGRTGGASDRAIDHLRATLKRAIGASQADMTLASAGIIRGERLTSRQITRALAVADQYRLYAVRSNERQLASALKGIDDPEVGRTLARLVRTHEHYGVGRLLANEVPNLAKRAARDVEQAREQRALQRYPGLAGYAVANKIGLAGMMRQGLDRVPGQVLTAKHIVESGCGAALTPANVKQALALLGRASELLGKTVWRQEDLQALHGALSTTRDQLETLRDGIAQAEISAGKTVAEPSLTTAVLKDLEALKGLVERKMDGVVAMAMTNPLSRRAVLESNLQWASIGARIMASTSQAEPNPSIYARASDIPKSQTGESRQGALIGLSEKWQARQNVAQGKLRDCGIFSDQIAAPRGKKDTTHPVVAGKADILRTLRQDLKSAGLSERRIAELTSKKALAGLQRDLLAEAGKWQQTSRGMVLNRNGVIRGYESVITPANLIQAPLARRYENAMISSKVTDGADGVRNLKISELRGADGARLAHIVGHGVLDMWDIQDGDARRGANAAGARQVLEAAVTGNAAFMARMATPSQPPPQLTHVSVNLITPDSIRHLPLIRNLNPKFDELTFTRNQFRAFDDAAGQGRLSISSPGPGAAGGAGGDLEAAVDINAITFSFGINKLATSPFLGMIGGVWRNVQDHNTRNMIKLIGDLGAPGSRGADMRGAAPGGFIGKVIDRVSEKLGSPDLPPGERARLTELIGDLRAQTEQVRSMFLDRAHEQAEADPAKMGREIVVLQTLADQALQRAGVDDMAATVSKGCKSDKDRGGVLDTEIKAKLALRDLGGDLRHDGPMAEQDRSIYLQVAAQSGQLENQARNAGLPGSKETPHMKDRIVDLQAMQYLAGLGAFAQA